MKTNKTLLLNDLIIFCGTLILYIITAISNNIFGIDNLFVNLIICLLAVAFSVCTMFYSYRKKIYTYGVSLVNLFVPIILCIAAFLIYFLPILKFVGNRGVNNSICFLMVFTLGTREYLVIAQLLKSKCNGQPPKTLNKTTNYSHIGFKFIYKFFKYFAICLYSVAVIFSIINTFCMFMDLSYIFDSFSELDSNITIFGNKIN